MRTIFFVLSAAMLAIEQRRRANTGTTRNKEDWRKRIGDAGSVADFWLDTRPRLREGA
jgi:hypothetical protein